MEKKVKERGGKEPKIIIHQGIENKDIDISFHDISRIHHFSLQGGHILASETETTTVTRITPEDVIESKVKNFNNSIFFVIGEN